MIKGIDISQWQGQPNFDTLKGEIDFAIIRSTYGNGYTDPQFIRNRNEARRVGLLLGYYHYAYPQYNKPEDEANWMLSIIGTPQDGEVIVLDFEENYSGDFVGWCKTFLDTVSAKLNGYKPLIYLNLSEVNGHDWSSIINEGYGLWLADYDNVSNDAPNTPWPLVAMKQYTSSGAEGGISGNIDMDVLFGDGNTFKAYGYKGAIITPSTPQPTLSDDQNRALKVIQSFHDKTDQVKNGNLEGAANAAVGAFSDVIKLAAQIDTLNAQITTLNGNLTTITTQRDKLAAQLSLCVNNQHHDPIPPKVVDPIFTTKLGKLFYSWAKSAG